MDAQPIVGLGEGTPDGPEALSDQRKITRVSKDWGDPPTPTVTSTPTVGGTTLKEALAELQKLPEWGTGGGNLSGVGGGEIQLTTTDGKSYTAEIHGDFFMTLPAWSGYAKATTAQQQAWDAMIAKLRKHEQEHVNIAYRNAQKLVQSLTNLPVDQAAQKIADSQQAGAGRAGRLRFGRQDRPRQERLRRLPEGRARHLCGPAPAAAETMIRGRPR